MAEPPPAGVTIAAIKAGFPFATFETLAAQLGVTHGELARTLSLSPRTLQRRRRDGALKVAESDRLARIARLLEHATDVLGAQAPTWLRNQKHFLKGTTPLAYADTEVGAWEIMQALGRLEHGVF